MSVLNTLVKKEFAHLDTFYFNSAYFGPSPYRAKQKVANALFKELDPSFYSYNMWYGITDRMRQKIANLLNTSDDNITFSASVSDLNNIIANGYPFKKGDVVCTVAQEYPSNVIPYMLAEKREGIEFKMLTKEDYTDEALKKALPKNTKIFIISHVAYNTGRRIDLISLGRFLRSRGILFVVDVTQSLGGIELLPEEVEACDVITCAGYKWMLGPYGMSYGYFSKEAQELIQHTNGNWITSPNSKDVSNLLDYTIETIPGARKYDRGQTPNMLAMACLESGLEVITEIGLDNIEKHNKKIRDHFLANYPKDKFELVTPGDLLGNIICVKGKGIDTNELEINLKHNNIDVSNREGNLRLSFHLFNTTEQVDTLLRTLDS